MDMSLTATNVAGRNIIVNSAIDLIWLPSLLVRTAISMFALA